MTIGSTPSTPSPDGSIPSPGKADQVSRRKVYSPRLKQKRQQAGEESATKIEIAAKSGLEGKEEINPKAASLKEKSFTFTPNEEMTDVVIEESEVPFPLKLPKEKEQLNPEDVDFILKESPVGEIAEIAEKETPIEETPLETKEEKVLRKKRKHEEEETVPIEQKEGNIEEGAPLLQGVTEENAIAPSAQPRLTKMQRVIETAANISKSLISGTVRAALEGATLYHLGMPGLIGFKAAQITYDYYQGNTMFLTGNLKQMSEALVLNYGPIQAYALLKTAQLGLDIFRRDWMGGFETVANILPNDTLTMAAFANNPEMRSQITNLILTSQWVKNQLFIHMKMNSPVYIFVENFIAPQDERIQKLLAYFQELNKPKSVQIL